MFTFKTCKDNWLAWRTKVYFFHVIPLYSIGGSANINSARSKGRKVIAGLNGLVLLIVVLLLVI